MQGIIGSLVYFLHELKTFLNTRKFYFTGDFDCPKYRQNRYKIALKLNVHFFQKPKEKVSLKTIKTKNSNGLLFSCSNPMTGKSYLRGSNWRACLSTVFPEEINGFFYFRYRDKKERN